MKQNKKRDVAHILKHIDVPPNEDKWKYGELFLNNLINQDLERCMELEYDDVLGKRPRKISQDYDLGKW